MTTPTTSQPNLPASGVAVSKDLQRHESREARVRFVKLAEANHHTAAGTNAFATRIFAGMRDRGETVSPENVQRLAGRKAQSKEITNLAAKSHVGMKARGETIPPKNVALLKNRQALDNTNSKPFSPEMILKPIKVGNPPPAAPIKVGNPPPAAPNLTLKPIKPPKPPKLAKLAKLAKLGMAAPKDLQRHEARAARVRFVKLARFDATAVAAKAHLTKTAQAGYSGRYGDEEPQSVRQAGQITWESDKPDSKGWYVDAFGKRQNMSMRRRAWVKETTHQRTYGRSAPRADQASLHYPKEADGAPAMKTLPGGRQVAASNRRTLSKSVGEGDDRKRVVRPVSEGGVSNADLRTREDGTKARRAIGRGVERNAYTGLSRDAVSRAGNAKRRISIGKEIRGFQAGTLKKPLSGDAQAFINEATGYLDDGWNDKWSNTQSGRMKSGTPFGDSSTGFMQHVGLTTNAQTQKRILDRTLAAIDGEAAHDKSAVQYAKRGGRPNIPMNTAKRDEAAKDTGFFGYSGAAGNKGVRGAPLTQKQQAAVARLNNLRTPEPTGPILSSQEGAAPNSSQAVAKPAAAVATPTAAVATPTAAVATPSRRSRVAPVATQATQATQAAAPKKQPRWLRRRRSFKANVAGPQPFRHTNNIQFGPKKPADAIAAIRAIPDPPGPIEQPVAYSAPKVAPAAKVDPAALKAPKAAPSPNRIRSDGSASSIEFPKTPGSASAGRRVSGRLGKLYS